MKLLKIKPFQETLNKGYCGPAVLKIILVYYGIKKSEEKLARLVGVSKSVGTNDKSLTRVFRKFGLKAKIKNNASFVDIEKYLAK